MSSYGILSIDHSLIWQQSTVNSQNTVYNSSNIRFSNSYTSGTGASQVNNSYFSSGSLSAGQTLQLDLFNLSTANFSGGVVKTIFIQNDTTGTGNGYVITLKGTGTNGLITPFSSGYLGTEIHPQSFKLFFDPTNGYSIDSGSRYFYLTDGGNGSNYQLAILGVV